MSKIDIGLKFKNLFYWPNEMLTGGPNSHRIINPSNPFVYEAPYGIPASQGWFMPDPGNIEFVDQTSNIPDYNIINRQEGFAGEYAATGSGSLAYISQPYPMSPLTTYRVRVWYKIKEMVVPSLGAPPIMAADAIKALSGPGFDFATVKFGAYYQQTFDSYINNRWFQVELIWRTMSTMNNSRRQIYFMDQLTGIPIQRVQIYGAELNVLEPGPAFFSDWPDLRGQLTY